jgi:hypothetical protein
MSILKSKIARAQMMSQDPPDPEVMPRDQQNLPDNTVLRRLRKRVVSVTSPTVTSPKGLTSCKNIMKNYSRILTSFALSNLSLPYLTPLLHDHNIELAQFSEFVRDRKSAANCIKGLRDLLLLVKETDSEEVSTMKKVFQEICVVFLKFFCVNWIFSGKVIDKAAHLNYRHKILRRIKSPALFTHLEDFA